MFPIFNGMQCPYCQASLTEASSECPSCQLSLQSVSALLGPVPRLGKGLIDTLSVIEKGQHKQIIRALDNLSDRFPQVEMHVLITKFDPQYPLSTHLFWLFNQGEFCASDRKDGENHSILLGLDPQQGRIGLIVGYGLEPFLAQKSLDHMLKKAQPSLGNTNPTKAILTVIDCLDHHMEGVCNDLKQAPDLDQANVSIQNQY